MAMDPVLHKLSNIMGPVEGPRLFNTTCQALGLASLDHPQDRLTFAGALIQRGGLLEAIGRAIKVQALLHGAKDK
jgi:hypothetical protein